MKDKVINNEDINRKEDRSKKEDKA